MSIDVPLSAPPSDVDRYRERLTGVRERARRLFDGGATGIQVTAALGEGMDAFSRELLDEALQAVDEPTRRALSESTAVVAIGGTGRRDPAPHSDVDLLFLYDRGANRAFEIVTSQLVRDFWDAGIKLGHAVRTVGETVALAREDPEVATALIEARPLWGSRRLLEELKRRFHRRVIRGRLRGFVNDCIAARKDERRDHGGGGTQLEPDVKRSTGGLRDVHLMRWIGFAHYGTADLDSLRLKGVFRNETARRLLAALEFLTRVRCDLHFAAGKEQDVLSRDEQLRLSAERDIPASLGQRPVEVFMQQYFRHSTAIAQTVRRFVALHRPESTGAKFFGFLMSHRLNGSLRVRPDGIDVPQHDLPAACRRLEDVLDLYRTAARCGIGLSPQVEEAVAHAAADLGGEVSQRAAELFLDILKRPGRLGATLRNMHETGILELVIPNMAHARCLLQFNQYHHYTVDEHTLRTIEAVASFQRDDGPLGTAYKAVRHKEILHLALLLHDLGKGFEEDHSNVGRAIAETTAHRLFLPDHHRETLAFLVHKHLRMTHLAFRRDCSDPDLLHEFSREVGSPETLRMLYVLTAADLSGVGHGVLTAWKADLLTELYDRTMLILSGKPYRFHEEQRIAAIKDRVRELCARNPAFRKSRDSETDDVPQQLDAFSAQYLSATTPERIRDDLAVLRDISAEEIVVEEEHDPSTGTVDYRVLVDSSLAVGCFHRITGALAAKRLEILAAQICTTADGHAVDSFKVIDPDFADAMPESRCDEVARSIRSALRKTSPVASLFRKSQRFGEDRTMSLLSDQQTRVVVDNDSSEQYTVIDVFAHDRRGLLYTLARAIHQLDLSVWLAKISTHLDQVVDVFYVTDAQGRRIRDGERLTHIREHLYATIDEFERGGFRQFVS
ncbi:MAG: [protein-PII] uridylyltransferase [Planctomycetaceae bacterium]